jgi:PEP-CTERM motif
MRRVLAALALSLFFALSVTAHADSFQYTIVWDIPSIASQNTSEFVGTYTFTVDSLLSGNTFVYGPGFTGPSFPGYTYVYAADYTVPAQSNVSAIMIGYFPDYSQYNSLGITSSYGFDLYQAGDGGVVSTSLLQEAANPNEFVADYGVYGFASMEITQLSTSPVPEPSTFTLLGFGALSLGTFAHRRLVRL